MNSIDQTMLIDIFQNAPKEILKDSKTISIWLDSVNTVTKAFEDQRLKKIIEIKDSPQ